MNKGKYLILPLVYFILIFFFGVSCDSNNTREVGHSKNKDSISYYIDLSRRESKPILKRDYLLRAIYHVNSLQVDSLKTDIYSKIVADAELNDFDDIFISINKSAMTLGEKRKDTSSIAFAHWDFGSYYTKKEKIDSAYYHFNKAYQNFKAIKNDLYTANMLYNMAFIQGRFKDYTGSEASIFEAIELFDKLKRDSNLYQCYNYLGLIYTELEDFERAIFYYNRALDYLDNFNENDSEKEATLSNIGLVYHRQKEYSEAIETFNEALKNEKLKTIDIYLYARLLDNLAYTNFLNGDTLSVKNNFYQSLKIRDSLKSSIGVAIVKRHLSEFYAANKDTLGAVLLALDAYQLVDEAKNNSEMLESLLLLSAVDTKNASKHLAEYVHLNDSLLIEDRKARNKFARIRFETDRYIEETEKLSQQQVFLIVGFISVVIILLLAYFNRVQIAKNKQLVMEAEQQKANQEIFSLMLKQQSVLEEGRINERHRIAEDLHDGVLGKIFGTRLGLGFLNINGDVEVLDKHKQFVNELQSIEKEIRAISHELKSEVLSSKTDFELIIKDLVESKRTIEPFDFEFVSSKNIMWNEVKDDVKINFYRIVQESIQNILKYAKATVVKVEFNLANNVLSLTVEDNGVGFNVKEKKKGIGLKNMESRASKINGFLKVNSVINQGTVIFVSCNSPYENET